MSNYESFYAVTNRGTIIGISVAAIKQNMVDDYPEEFPSSEQITREDAYQYLYDNSEYFDECRELWVLVKPGEEFEEYIEHTLDMGFRP